MFNLIKTFSRPLSPHLTIYSSQITSMFSIWHRITGVGLIIFLMANLTFLKIISYKIFIISYIEVIYTTSWIYNTFIINLVLGFMYHVLNGLRHITWDLGYNLSLNSIKFSIQIIIFLLIIIVIITYKILL